MSSAQEMPDRLDIEDFFREIKPDLCHYAYALRENGFTSSKTMKSVWARRRLSFGYPSDPLRKVSALQTEVELAGNLSNKQNFAENYAYRALANWKKVFQVYK